MHGLVPLCSLGGNVKWLPAEQTEGAIDKHFPRAARDWTEGRLCESTSVRWWLATELSESSGRSTAG